jgi:chaperonin GroEL
MSNIIEYNHDARKKLLSGVTKLSNAVVSTLGPFGRNVLFNDNGEVRSTKDGVTVARNITLEDPIENIGCEIVKKAAINSANQAGDGTTTTTLLAHSLVNSGINKLDKGVNATQLKKEIDAAVDEVVSKLKSTSIKVTDQEQLKQIATISSNNDEETGNLIAEALEKVGQDGVVSIEESKTGETKLEVVEGMQFDRGYKSPYFVTNNATMQAVLDEPYIFIYDGIITQAKELLPLLDNVSQKNNSLVIIAEDIEGEALATLIVNKMRGILKVCAVKAPDFGARRTLILEDIAVLTGGTVLSKTKGIKLDKMTAEQFSLHLGRSRTVTVSKDKSTIIDGKGDVDKLIEHAEDIKKQLDTAEVMFEKEQLQQRLAKLSAGVAIVHVGGANEIEMKERKDRVEDALFATKAAIEEGILPGGGVALFNARKGLKSLKTQGSSIVYEALSKPFSQILENAGVENVPGLLYHLETSESEWMGYDLKTNDWVDMKEKGIIDPTKVVRLALENAAAVAGMILITETVIYEKPSDKKKEELSGFTPEMY